MPERDDLEDMIDEWAKVDPQLRARIDAALKRRTAGSVTVSAADLRRVLRYMETVQPWAGQDMLNALDRLGDAVLKARLWDEECREFGCHDTND